MHHQKLNVFSSVNLVSFLCRVTVRTPSPSSLTTYILDNRTYVSQSPQKVVQGSLGRMEGKDTHTHTTVMSQKPEIVPKSFKGIFRLFCTQLFVRGNHLYYLSYFATFSLLFQKLLVSLVKTPIS